MDSFYMNMAFGYQYTPKAKRGTLLAFNRSNGNEIRIKDDQDGRERAERMKTQGWDIYDEMGRW